MSSNPPRFLQMPSPAPTYPPAPSSVQGAVTGVQGRDSNRVKIQHGMNSTAPMEFSLFLHQPLNPSIDPKRSSNTHSTRTPMYVQDSGVVMVSTSSLPQQIASRNKSVVSNGSKGGSGSQKDHKVTQPIKSAQPGDDIEDDWEVVYPDN
jgi:hypothetical protein